MATFFVTNKGQACLLKEVNLRLFQEFGRKTVEWQFSDKNKKAWLKKFHCKVKFPDCGRIKLKNYSQV